MGGRLGRGIYELEVYDCRELCIKRGYLKGQTLTILTRTGYAGLILALVELAHWRLAICILRADGKTFILLLAST
jgi:hypothetical protein